MKELNNMLKTDEELNSCFCIGKVGNDPYCPCEMRSRGLEPTNLWTPEAIAEFEKALLPYCE